jgi:hypothetical protein
VTNLASLQTVPIVAGLILALLVFCGWVYAMIRIDTAADPLVQEGADLTSSGAAALGEREWLRVPPVRPGGVCQVPGSVRSTATGVAMICTPEADGTARWRWRHPTTRSA